MEETQPVVVETRVHIEVCPDDYDVTQKCLSWRESCAANGEGSVYPVIPPVEAELLDNEDFYKTDPQPVDNAHHQSQHVMDVNQNIPPKCTQSQGMASSNYLTSIQEEQEVLDNTCNSSTMLDNYYNQSIPGESIYAMRGNHCHLGSTSALSKPVVISRTRRDSEESMDTTVSQTSGPHLNWGLSPAMSDTASSYNSADYLAREETGSDDEMLTHRLIVDQGHSGIEIGEEGKIEQPINVQYISENDSESIKVVASEYSYEFNLEKAYLAEHDVPQTIDRQNVSHNSLQCITVGACSVDASNNVNDEKTGQSEGNQRLEANHIHTSINTYPHVSSLSQNDVVHEPETFSTFIEGPDPEYVNNPPRVTERLIVVENEPLLINSQLSLWEEKNLCGQDYEISGCNHYVMTRASTLPDLSAYNRCYEDHDMAWWVYQDARLLVSENALQKSHSMYSASSGFEDCHYARGKEREDDGSFSDLSGIFEGNQINGESERENVVPSSEHMAGMVLLSVCVGVLFMAMGAVRNLLSSLHPEDGLGVISLALMFAGYSLGSLVSQSLVRVVQPRTCLLASIVPNFLFLLCNLHPNAWLLLPLSACQGVSVALVWSVVSAYVTLLARGRASDKGDNVQIIISRFYSILSLVYQGSLIAGNISASVLLMYGNSMHSLDSNTDSPSKPELLPVSSAVSLKLLSTTIQPSTSSPSLLSICGAAFPRQGQVLVDAGDPWLHPNNGTIYMLHGTFIGCVLVALGIAVFGIEPLNMKFLSPVELVREADHLITVGSSWQKIKRSVWMVALRWKDVKFLLLAPMMVYSVMQFAFVSAEITSAFITCPQGIDKVGFSMALFVIGGFPASFFCGQLSKKFGRLPLITTGKKELLYNCTTPKANKMHYNLLVLEEINR